MPIKDPIKRKEYAAAYRKKWEESGDAKKYRDEYRKKNKKKISKRRKEYYQKNKEHIRNKMKPVNNRYYNKNRDRLLQKRRGWRNDNKEYVDFRQKEWEKKNPKSADKRRKNAIERSKKNQKQRIDNLDNRYIESGLTKQFGLSLKIIREYPELIESKRMEIKINRLIKSKKNGKTKNT